MNKTICIYCNENEGYDNVMLYMESIPEEYRDSCLFTTSRNNGGFCIEYTRPETEEEEQKRVMDERRKLARKIIEGKIAAGEEVPDCLRSI